MSMRSHLVDLGSKSTMFKRHDILACCGAIDNKDSPWYNFLEALNLRCLPEVTMLVHFRFVQIKLHITMPCMRGVNMWRSVSKSQLKWTPCMQEGTYGGRTYSLQ